MPSVSESDKGELREASYHFATCESYLLFDTAIPQWQQVRFLFLALDRPALVRADGVTGRDSLLRNRSCRHVAIPCVTRSTGMRRLYAILCNLLSQVVSQRNADGKIPTYCRESSVFCLFSFVVISVLQSST